MKLIFQNVQTNSLHYSIHKIVYYVIRNIGYITAVGPTYILQLRILRSRIFYFYVTLEHKNARDNVINHGSVGGHALQVT